MTATPWISGDNSAALILGLVGDAIEEQKVHYV
jgi:hypothetical protein